MFRFAQCAFSNRSRLQYRILAWLLTILCCGVDCWGQQAAVNQRHSREEATAAIPIGQLNPVAQQKVQQVLNRVSLYRRLPVTSIEVDSDYYRFLLRNPEVIVEIWRLMGVTKMRCERTGDFTFHCDDGAGTVSDVELLYGTENLHLYFGAGAYEGPLNKRPLRGDCLIMLRTENRKDAQGRTTTQNVLDVFLKIDNATASLVAKTIQPIVGRTADHNFVESLNFIQRLNETTAKNGSGVQGMADRLDGLSEPVRRQFVDIAEVVFQRAQFAASYPTLTSQPTSLPNYRDLGQPTASEIATPAVPTGR